MKPQIQRHFVLSEVTNPQSSVINSTKINREGLTLIPWCPQLQHGSPLLAVECTPISLIPGIQGLKSKASFCFSGTESEVT